MIDQHILKNYPKKCSDAPENKDLFTATNSKHLTYNSSHLIEYFDKTNVLYMFKCH